MPRRGFWVPLFSLASCTAPGLGHVMTETAPSTSVTTSGGAATLDEVPTGGGSGASATTSTGSTTGPDHPDEGGGSGGDADLPTVLDVEFTPNPLESVGTITVAAKTEFAAGVRMQLAGEEPVLLAPGQAGEFVGAIEVLSGLANGTHEAVFTAWQGDVQSSPRTEPYTVALPPPGVPVLWDTFKMLGPGQIEALDLLPPDHVVALGTFDQQGQPRCFLHRRDLAGKYGAMDVVDVHPGQHCTATDVRVTANGSIYILTTVTGGDGPRWRLSVAHWGEAPVIVRTGAKDEVAHALALAPGEEPVVCGAGPALADIDARVWHVQGEPQSFDYRPTGFEPQTFDETIRDCEFVDDRLVMVGDTFGLHDNNDMLMVQRMRMFVLEDGVKPQWTVPGVGPGDITQSRANTLAIDDEGRYIVGLYVCEDVCTPSGELRIYEPGGGIAEWVPLPFNVQPPNDLAWSSAGYVALASAEIVDVWSSRFLLQAYLPGEYEPTWTYKKAEMPSAHIAKAVVVAPGVVVGAGVGGDGLPAFAFVNP